MKAETIEDYILTLGSLGVTLQLLKEAQAEAKRTGILQFDEEEQAETIDYMLDKGLTALNDQLRLLEQRSPEGWDNLKEKINQKIKEKLSEVDNKKEG